MKAYLICLTLSISVLMCFSASIAMQTTEDGGYPREFVDSAGRHVAIQMPVERIIVQSGYFAEAVHALGEGDNIIGVTDTIHKRPEIYPWLQDKPVVGTWNSFDYEMIGEMAQKDDSIVPNLIVLCYSYGAMGGKSYAVDSFQKGFAPFNNITLIGLDFTNPENITDSMTKLGLILDREEEAEKYNSWYQDKVEHIKSETRRLPLKRVYIETGSSTGVSELTAYGPGSGFSSLVNMAGGTNIADGLKEKFPKVTWEWVITQNPDIILKYRSADTLGWEKGPSKDTLELERTRNEVMQRAGAERIAAVKNGDIFLCFSEVLYGLDNPAGLAWMAKLLHPEADIDPDRIWEEYKAIMNIDYPDGKVFVWPEA